MPIPSPVLVTPGTDPFSGANAAPTPYSAASIVVVGGDNQVSAINTQFNTTASVRVLDGSGGPITNEIVHWSVPQDINQAGGYLSDGAGGWTLVSQSTLTNITGVAFSPAVLANGVVGQWQWAAQPNSNLPLFAVLTFNNSATTPVPIVSSVQVVSGDNQYALQNATFAQPITFEFRDQNNNPIPSLLTHTFLQSGPAGMTFLNLTAPTYVDAFTNAQGRVSITVIAGSGLGLGIIRSSQLGGAVPNAVALATVYDVTVPASISVTSGNGQQRPVTLQFLSELVVTVRNVVGAILTGKTVRWTAPLTNPFCRFAGSQTFDAVTDVNGVATSIKPDAGTTVGGYSVGVALVPPVSGVTASFTLNNSVAATPEAGQPLLYCEL